jgi:hypothetical protein
MAERINVFISSTSKDLTRYRAKVKEAVLRAGAFPIAMEEFTATERNALQLCYDEVQHAEVFIGIYAHRYGYAPGTDATYTTTANKVRPGDGVTGITHLEYLWAMERKLPMLLYVVSDKGEDGEELAWPLSQVEDEPGKSRLKGLKSLIMGKHVVGFFYSPDHLAAQVSSVLPKILPQRTGTAKSELTARADFYKHIALPPNYVLRADLLGELRLSLLGDANSVALTSALKRNPTALHGMGGIGKSVMARALCDDVAVQAAFPDGILWTTLGQEPNLVMKLREWVEALGGTISENAPTPDSLKAKLAELVERRACLLIVDDVWERKHADTFRVSGAKSRLLLTTRDAEIARLMGADVQPIPAMSLPEAVALLKEWAGGTLANTSPDLKAQIVNRLGRLPLAVKLAGAQLQKKDAQKWLDTFNARKLKLSRPDPEDVHSSLEQAFGLSLDALDTAVRRLYAALAIFREDEPIREVAIARLWEALDTLDADEVQELVDDLAARALLEVLGAEFPRAVVLHDLLREFMEIELGADREQIHQHLLDAYRATQSGTSWHTAPDDGYLYDHLAYHLKATKNYPELKVLFDNHDWLHVRLPQSNYSYDGYIGDVMTAWEDFAHPAALQQIEAGESPAAIADCLRYALIRTSINSIAANYPPELVARAVETGLWKPSRALSVAARVPDWADEVKMRLAILGTGILSVTDRTTVCKSALEAALAIHPADARAEALAALAPYLEGQARAYALARGMEAALTTYREEDRPEALAALAPHLEGQARANAVARGLEASLTISDEWKRVRVRVALVSLLDGQARTDALAREVEAVLGIYDEWFRARALAVLALHLEGQPRADALARGVEAALAIREEEHSFPEWFRARALAALAPHLEGQAKADALAHGLDAALTLWERDRAKAIAMLAPHLEGQAKADALAHGLDAALKIEDEDKQDRAEVLATLASQLEGQAKADALAHGLDAALAIDVAHFRAKALAALAPHLEGDLLARGLEAALAIDDKSHCVAVLVALAPYLDEKQLAWTAETVLAIRNENILLDSIAELVESLAPYLEGDLLARGLETALAMESKSDRARVLTALAPRLKGQAKADALAHGLEAALAIGDLLFGSMHQAVALAALASQLEGQAKADALAHGLEAALEGQDRAKALAVLAPHLEGQAKADALAHGLEAAQAIWYGKHRAEALAMLAPHLEGQAKVDALTRGIEAVLACRDEGSDRAEALAALAPQLEGELLVRGLEVALAIDDEWSRARVLAALAPQLEGELLVRGLEAALAIDIEFLRASALAGFLPVAPDTGTLVRNIRQAVEANFLAMQHAKREQELMAFFIGQVDLFSGKVFAPPIFTPQTLSTIAGHIIEICNDWEWV